MTAFTAYANKKFEVLARHGCVISRECVRDAVEGAFGTETESGPLFFAQRTIDERHAVRVAYKKETGGARVITFYPVKNNERE